MGLKKTINNNDPPLNFFKPRIYWKFGYFWKAGIVTFQKSNICPNKFLETSELSRKIHFNSSNFQQISALEPNLTINFVKFCAEILIVWSSTNNVSKTLSCIKIYPLELKISSILCQKTCEIGWKSDEGIISGIWDIMSYLKKIFYANCRSLIDEKLFAILHASKSN